MHKKVLIVIVVSDYVKIIDFHVSEQLDNFVKHSSSFTSVLALFLSFVNLFQEEQC